MTHPATTTNRGAMTESTHNPFYRVSNRIYAFQRRLRSHTRHPPILTWQTTCAVCGAPVVGAKHVKYCSLRCKGVVQAQRAAGGEA